MFRMSDRMMLSMRVLCVLSRERDASNSEIAARLGCSPNTLAKLLQMLSGGGLVESRRGPGGGSRLTRTLGRISLAGVHEAVHGELPSCCQLHEEYSSRCPLCRVARDVRRRMRRTPVCKIRERLR